MPNCEVSEFKFFMDNKLNTMLDELDKTGEMLTAYEYITVSWAGLTFSVPMHADNYEALETFVNRVIENERS